MAHDPACKNGRINHRSRDFDCRVLKKVDGIGALRRPANATRSNAIPYGKAVDDQEDRDCRRQPCITRINAVDTEMGKRGIENPTQQSQDNQLVFAFVAQDRNETTDKEPQAEIDKVRIWNHRYGQQRRADADHPAKCGMPRRLKDPSQKASRNTPNRKHDAKFDQQLNPVIAQRFQALI